MTRKMWVGEGGKNVAIPSGSSFKVLAKVMIVLICINLILIESIEEGNAKRKKDRVVDVPV